MKKHSSILKTSLALFATAMFLLSGQSVVGKNIDVLFQDATSRSQDTHSLDEIFITNIQMPGRTGTGIVSIYCQTNRFGEDTNFRLFVDVCDPTIGSHHRYIMDMMPFPVPRWDCSIRFHAGTYLVRIVGEEWRIGGGLISTVSTDWYRVDVYNRVYE